MEDKIIKLNLGGAELFDGGSGSPKLEGFTNIDIRNYSGVDIVHDIISLPMFKDDSVDEIRASHVIEHIHPENITKVLAEWHRILKPEGKIAIIDWKKESMDQGPPIEIRISDDTIIEQLDKAGFKNTASHKILSLHSFITAQKLR